MSNIPAGSKYGPLTVPESLKDKSADTSSTTSDEEQTKADQKAMLIWAGIGIVGLAVIGLIVLAVVKRSRRNRNGNDGPGGPVGYPAYGHQPDPPQRNPCQQPEASSQNPYQQQPTPPQSHWPPQQ